MTLFATECSVGINGRNDGVVALVVRGHNSKILDAYEPEAPQAEEFVTV